MVVVGMLTASGSWLVAGTTVEVKADLEVEGEVAVGDPGVSDVQLAVKGSDTALSAESTGTTSGDYGIWTKGEVALQS